MLASDRGENGDPLDKASDDKPAKSAGSEKRPLLLSQATLAVKEKAADAAQANAQRSSLKTPRNPLRRHTNAQGAAAASAAASAAGAGAGGSVPASAAAAKDGAVLVSPAGGVAGNSERTMPSSPPNGAASIASVVTWPDEADLTSPRGAGQERGPWSGVPQGAAAGAGGGVEDEKRRLQSDVC
jgi:hypothetical protein